MPLGPHGDGQIEPQTLDRHLFILVLTASLGSFRPDSTRQMMQHNGRFGPIAMLSAWAGTASSGDFTILQQTLDFNGGRMHDLVSTFLRMWVTNCQYFSVDA
jgi:hypothetical protein